MSHFRIYAKGRLIGYSSLEFGDPPMGVAHGQFIPSSEYADIKTDIINTYGNQKHFDFTLFTEDGKSVPCDTIAINDLSNEFGDTEIFLEIIVITDLVYDEFFSHHREEYEKRFL